MVMSPILLKGVLKAGHIIGLSRVTDTQEGKKVGRGEEQRKKNNGGT